MRPVLWSWSMQGLSDEPHIIHPSFSLLTHIMNSDLVHLTPLESIIRNRASSFFLSRYSSLLQRRLCFRASDSFLDVALQAAHKHGRLMVGFTKSVSGLSSPHLLHFLSSMVSIPYISVGE